ncbi:MAG: hypothetical protein IRY85_07195 [Micromonosporaceae bacterium]|nr:hypothetical protein [Micromonosporaceae bacterium]
MRGKLMFAAGVGIGYVLGTRAGRERFDQIAGKAKQFWQSDTVQEAAGAVQAKAGRLYDTGKQMMTERSQRMRQKNEPKRPQHEAPERPEAAWEAPVGFPVSTSY